MSTHTLENQIQGRHASVTPINQENAPETEFSREKKERELTEFVTPWNVQKDLRQKKIWSATLLECGRGIGASATRIATECGRTPRPEGADQNERELVAAASVTVVQAAGSTSTY